jgi:hypothetical protein
MIGMQNETYLLALTIPLIPFIPSNLLTLSMLLPSGFSILSDRLAEALLIGE